MEKKISIIIPCYNAENYIDQSLDSLVNQTLGIEQMDIIIDDASTDSCRVHINKYKERYPDSFHLIINKTNSGQAIVRNTGMDLVKTDYLAFMDADDWVEAQLYEKMLETAEEYHCDLVECAYVMHVGQQVRVNRPSLSEKLYVLEDEAERMELFARYGEHVGIWRTLYMKIIIGPGLFVIRFIHIIRFSLWGIIM